ncbi:uncharacterized protein V1510DRAFT_234729 [Dipodascopsis tothii]|uniref:uncharacterized protein n=1 Tax=Dipodascopsis tothii TaxID=44089 RepID=UPI0034CECCD6
MVSPSAPLAPIRSYSSILNDESPLLPTRTNSSVSSTASLSLVSSSVIAEATKEAELYTDEEPEVVPRTLFGRIIKRLRGPQPPRPSRVTLLYAPAQLFPLRVSKAIKRKPLKTLIVMAYLASWFLIFVFLERKSKFSPILSTDEDVVLLECNSNPLWKRGPGNAACGFDAAGCGPTENTTLSFRCPSSCAGETTYSMTTVGTENVIYQPYVIGDSNGYRADSYICTAAIHAGVTSNLNGGCGKVVLSGARDSFPASEQNGVQTIGFNSYYPASFVFDVDVTSENCYDLRWAITGVNIFLSAVFSYFVSHPLTFFWTMFLMGFWSIVLASDPPPTTHLPNPGAEVVSVAFERLLPALFIGHVIYQVAVYPQMKNIRAQLTKTVFWVGAFWVGALNNYTFDELPLDRFVAEDIKALPGGLAAIIILLLVIFSCACGQAYVIWKNGKFFPYLFAYSLVASTLIIMAFVPYETLRIHHYILGLLILPATAFQTTLSVLYQGLSVGMFLNGATRWGMDSILQTEYQLRRGGPRNTDLAMFTTNMTNFNGDLVAWDYPKHQTANWTGFSLLINDVERYRGPNMNISLDEFYAYADLWEQRYDHDWYFRIGMYSEEGIRSDYTRAAIAQANNGTWVPAPSGPS